MGVSDGIEVAGGCGAWLQANMDNINIKPNKEIIKDLAMFHPIDISDLITLFCLSEMSGMDEN